MADNNGTNSQAEQDSQQSQADKTSNSQSQADSSNTNSQTDSKKTYTSEEFDRLQKNKRESDNEAKNLRDRLKTLEAERTQAEADKLKEAGEFKTLYEQEQARVKSLEPVQEENKFLRDYAMKQLEATIEKWPDEVKTFDPGKKAPLQDRLDWMEKSKPLVAKLQGSQQQQRQQGAVKSPFPANNQQGPKTADDYYKEMKAGRSF